MNGIILTGYCQWYAEQTGTYPQTFGDDCLVEVKAVSQEFVTVELNGIAAYIPAKFIQMKGVYDENLPKARQADQSE